MRVPRFFVLILLAVFTISIARTATAQDDPNFETGMKPFGAYHGGNIDTINLFNGMLNLDIPLISYPQRGGKLKLDFHLRYADIGSTTTVVTYCYPPPIGCNSYPVPSTIPGWCRGNGQPANDVQLCHGFEVNDESGIGTQDITTASGGVLVDNASIIEASGAAHMLLPTSGNSNSTAWESVDGTAFQRTTGTGNQFYTETVTGPDGTMYDGASYLRQDTNGNAITYSNTMGWTDTLGRVIPPIPAATSNVSNCPQPPSVPVAPSSSLTWSLPGISGGTYPVTFCFIQMSETNPIGLIGTYPSPYTYTGTELQSVVLPNGTSWTFEYTTDGNADLAEVIFPTGGSISYSGYTTFDAIPTSPDYHRAATTRTLNPNDGITPASTWNYAYSVASNTVTTVVSAPPSTGTTQDDTVHTFPPFTLGAYSFALGYESTVQYYQGSHTQGSLLKTTSKQYYWTSYPYNIIGVVPETVTNVWANGQQAKTTYTYDAQMNYYPPDLEATNMQLLIGQGEPLSGATYGRLLDQYDYDYSGSLLRTTTKNWLAFSNSSYLSANLLNLPSSAQVSGSGPGSLTDYGYDAAGGIHGNLTSTSSWLNTTSSYLTTSNVYDSYGRMTSTTDPKNNKTTYGYGSCYAGSGPTSVTNALNQTTNNCYDANSGLLTSTTDRNNQTTSFQYDDMFRATLIKYPDGGQTTFVYPNAYQVNIQELFNSGGAYRGSWLEVDGFGREIRQAVMNGESEPWDQVDTCYDGLGRVSYKTYPYQGPGWGSSQYTCTQPGDTFAYDPLNRTTSATHSDGSSVLTSYTGRATSVQDEGNGTQRVQRISQVDGLGRLTSVCEVTSTTLSVGISGSSTPAACGQDIAATGFLTAYAYDALDDLTSVTQGPLNARSFLYDSLSRLTSSTNPESGTTTYTYDADGNVSTKVDARGTTTCFGNWSSGACSTSVGYDALNRVLEKSYSDGTASAYFYYDQNSWWNINLTNTIGRLAYQGTYNGTEWPSASGFSYDPMGRVINNPQCPAPGCPNGPTALTYTYDLMGDMTSSTDGEGVTFNYAYNVGARLTSITSSLSDAQHPALLWGNPVHYNAAGAVTSATFGNNIIETRSYDARLRLTGITDGSIYAVTIPSYAPDSDILTADDNVNGNWTYGYDPFNRLISSNQNSGATTYSYAYDRFGNRWNQTVTAGSGVSSSLGFGANNRIVSGVGATYDAAGDTTDDGTTAYTYDAEGRVTTAVNAASGTSTYVYDADGQRVQKTTAGSVADFLYDLAGHEITEMNSAGAWMRGEVYAGGRHVATYSSGTTYFIHSDWLGTERIRSGVNGTSAETCTSLPFGDWLNCTLSEDVSPMHFTGKEYDYETGLENFGARYDSSAMGRFMTPDPKAIQLKRFLDPQDLNLYLYTVDNPLRYRDPDGKDWESAWNDVKTFVNETYAHVTVGAGFEAKVQAGPLEAKAGVSATVSGGAPPLSEGVGEVKTTIEAGANAGVKDGPQVGQSVTVNGPNVVMTHADGTMTSNPGSVEQTGSLSDNSKSVESGDKDVGLSIEAGDGLVAGGDIGATKEGWGALGDAFKQAWGAIYTPPPPPPAAPKPPPQTCATCMPQP